MVDVIVSPATRYRNTLNDERESQMVFLWCLPPEKPSPPVRPTLPRGKDGDPEYDLAKIELKGKLERYEQELKEYGRLKAEYEGWAERYGGPIEIKQWSCDARDSLAHDQRAVAEGRQTARRYFISSRTRGYGHLPNGGLPPGVTPGHGHAESVAREAAEDRALAIARGQDPVFGGYES